jgi:hypothetical protein
LTSLLLYSFKDSCKPKLSLDYTKYELFSVIIHSGSAYGGHYHTYIRDIDNLGVWSKPNENVNASANMSTSKTSTTQTIKCLNEYSNAEASSKEICLICNEEKDVVGDDAELLNLDYIKYDSPLELLKAFMYNKYKYDSIGLNKLCQEMQKCSGISWSKCYKSKYGSIERYMRKHSDTFEFSEASSDTVKLKPHDRINVVSSASYESDANKNLIQTCLDEIEQQQQYQQQQNSELTEGSINEIKDELDDPAKGKWFDFDDSRVTPIPTSRIRKQFEGKESAYMLFYRRQCSKTAARPPPTTNMPVWLLNEISEENRALSKKRADYESRLNSVHVECYLAGDFYMEQKVLNLKQEYERDPFLVNVDKRNFTLHGVREALASACIESLGNDASQQHDTVAERKQSRREACLNMLFDDESPVYWLLAARVDTSSSESGRYSYYIKQLLLDEKEETGERRQAGTSWSELFNENDKLVLVLSKSKDKWPVGSEYEPIRLVMRFIDSSSPHQQNFNVNDSASVRHKIGSEVSFTFSKCTLVKQLKEELVSFILSKIKSPEQVANKSFIDSAIGLFEFKYERKSNEKASLNDDTSSLADLRLSNGDSVAVLVDFSLLASSTAAEFKMPLSRGTSLSCGVDPHTAHIDSSAAAALCTKAAFSNNIKPLVKLDIVSFIDNDTMQKSSTISLASSYSTCELSVPGAEIIGNVKVLAISTLGLPINDYEQCQLRLVDEENLGDNEWFMNYLMMKASGANEHLYESTTIETKVTNRRHQFAQAGSCLYQDATVDEVLSGFSSASSSASNSKNGGVSQRFFFILCEGRAPLKAKNEIALRCFVESDRNISLRRSGNANSDEDRDEPQLCNKLEDGQSEASSCCSEVIICPSECRIIDLVAKIVDSMQLHPLEASDEDAYYLKTIDWIGDPDVVLNDLHMLCEQVPLKHNQSLLITKGRLVPPNHLKIKVWIHAPSASDASSRIETQMSELTLEQASASPSASASVSASKPSVIAKSDFSKELALNNLIEQKRREYKLLDELVCKYDMKLDDLRMAVQSLLMDRSTDNCEHVRLRVLKRLNHTTTTPTSASNNNNNLHVDEINFQMKKALFEWHKTLRQLHLTQETDICVQVLADEDAINQGIVLLDCVQMSLGSRMCDTGTYKQISWNVNNGATLVSLKESILRAYGEQLHLSQSDLFRMTIAKRLVDKYQWIVLKEQMTSKQQSPIEEETHLNCNNNQNVTQKKKKKSNQQQQQQAHKANLKQSPYNLEDGDLVVFTMDVKGNQQPIEAADFMSAEDMEIAKKKNISAAELSRIRKERRKDTDPLGLGASRKSYRREVGIKIETDDFNL